MEEQRTEDVGAEDYLKKNYGSTQTAICIRSPSQSPEFREGPPHSPEFWSRCLSYVGGFSKVPNRRVSPGVGGWGGKIRDGKYMCENRSICPVGVFFLIVSHFSRRSWIFKGRVNHEVHFVNWNTGILEVESAKLTVCTSRFSPSLIHGLCAIFASNWRFMCFFQAALDTCLASPLPCQPLSSRLHFTVYVPSRYCHFKASCFWVQKGPLWGSKWTNGELGFQGPKTVEMPTKA